MAESNENERPGLNVAGLLIILGLVVLAMLPNGIPSIYPTIVTLSVNAHTESIRLRLKPERTYSWRLPPGSFVMLSGGGDGCTGTEPDITCSFTEEETTLQVTGNATLELQSLSGNRFILLLLPADDATMSVAVFDADGSEQGVTSDLTFFESAANAPETRLPVIVESATVGALLHESSVGSGSEESTWQPMLKGGDYAAFASVGADRERYRVFDGTFGPGDVVEMRARPEGDLTKSDAAIWGHVSIIQADSGNSTVPELHASLHTPFSEVTVRRFGAPAGHKISTSRWQVMSKLPFWQSTWVIFVSLLLVYEAYCAASDRHAHWSPLAALRRSGKNKEKKKN